MKVTRFSIFLIFFCLTVSSSSFAGSAAIYDFVGAGSSSASRHDTDCYVGIKALFGELKDPRALVGCRQAKIKSNNDVNGFDISISAKFLNGFDLEKLRLKGFSGNTSTQAEAGGGYDFNKKAPFVGLSAKAPYSTFGIDVLPKDGLELKNLEPYMQLDTVGKYRKPRGNGVGGCQQVGFLGGGEGFLNDDCSGARTDDPPAPV
jgi:hypothetical protein